MVVLSHRGYWKEESEKNQFVAFKRSFKLGFGTETDIRDYNGELAISHDMADESCMKVETFFEIYKSFDNKLPLALNIKADGLQQRLKELIKKFEIRNYFVFDMSVPDGLVSLKYGFNTFTRQSEYEKEPSFYKEAEGIWLDEFHAHWIDEGTIQFHLDNKKKICIVSPDLHKRDYKKEWQHYKEIEKKLHISNLMLCTDQLEEAKEYFNE